jgi:hypothetical protein
MSCDFEHGLRAAHSMMSKTDYYFEKHTKNIIRIRYDDIVSDPMAVIKAICEFLNLNVSTDDMQRTLRNHSKERVKALVESLRLIDVTGPGHIADANKREKYETVRNLDGSFRVYDRTTGFQTNHITEAGKEWRIILTEEQKKELMNLTEGWLVKYGFHL